MLLGTINFKTARGKDLVTMLMMSWLLAICAGQIVGAHLNDITEAFDRAFEIHLLARCHAANISIFIITQHMLEVVLTHGPPFKGTLVPVLARCVHVTM